MEEVEEEEKGQKFARGAHRGICTDKFVSAITGISDAAYSNARHTKMNTIVMFPIRRVTYDGVYIQTYKPGVAAGHNQLDSTMPGTICH